jgi:DUF4097 and DUF4098 domain-containing protein YvlB
MESMQHTAIVGLVVAACMVSAATADTRKEYRYTVGPKASVTVDTEYGSISVKPGNANQVLVVAMIRSDKAGIDISQEGSRLEFESHLLPGADEQTGRVDYEVTVPSDTILNLHSSNGPISAEHIQADVAVEGATAPIEIRSVSHGHVHVKTMNGTITLSDVRSAHVEITSISGDVHLSSVSGPLVQVNSGSGRIFYDGDFGSGGDYNFSTHTGDIEALIASDASADFTAHSMQGHVQSDVPLKPKEHTRFPVEVGRSFFGTVGKAASEVVLKSFSGKIRLKQR